MKEYQLKALIYDLYCDVPKLRALSKSGDLTMNDLWDIQEMAVEMAKKDDLITE